MDQGAFQILFIIEDKKIIAWNGKLRNHKKSITYNCKYISYLNQISIVLKEYQQKVCAWYNR